MYQETCIKALEQAGAVESKQHLLRWFHKVARNRAIDILRARGENVMQLSDQTLAILEEDWDSRENSRRADLIDALSRCLDVLTPRSREMMSLRYFQDRSGVEIAGMTGTKVTSVYQTIARVHKALAECLREQPEYQS
ncbi:RNA polymerase sigma factor [Rubripirellula reticaptiva]|uniref:RNA polymerase sigma factor SigV n=1 Tax=Rubripirellula reticaptiva TaxID=2528013 RepID=A0A5C6EEB1_9BACT|nr:RNA polymerase sigma factor [Rubripirellula reticaptiva]TWU46794.1 RNA polymerase sigma factor SigV [Rubripirellula reticaptiva]